MSEEQEAKELPEVTEETLASASEPEAPQPEVQSLGFVMDVPLRLSVQIGATELLVRDVLQLAKGSVVELDRMNGEPADVFVNERLVAKGEVTVTEDRLAVRILELLAGRRTGDPAD